MPVNPDDYRTWIGIVRDGALVAVGVFMLVWETIVIPSPNQWVIGAGLTALGLPAAIRLDIKKRGDSAP